MILVDTNALVVLLVGLMDTNLLGKHKRTSIYDKEDFDNLLATIGDFKNIVTLPNIWTEVDNLLNDFNGNYKYSYINQITTIIKETSETYLKTKQVCDNYNFIDLGLTDTLIIELAKECNLLITSDSRLSDYAMANGIKVYDLVRTKNEQLK